MYGNNNNNNIYTSLLSLFHFCLERYATNESGSVVVVLNIRLLHVEKINLVLPLSACNCPYVAHAWVLQIVQVSLFYNV